MIDFQTKPSGWHRVTQSFFSAYTKCSAVLPPEWMTSPSNLTGLFVYSLAVEVGRVAIMLTAGNHLGLDLGGW
jgi:hypothetical protein